MATGTTVLQQQTIAVTPSDWSQTVTFAPFDPTLGTLVDVQVGITAAATGSVALENLGATSGTVNVSQPGTISVFDPSGVLITSVNPDASGSASLTEFDGTDDYAGTSGTTVSDLSNTQSTLAFYKATTSELALFSGADPIPLTVDATLGFDETGLANLQALSHASAGAVISLQYDYVAITPGGSNLGGETGGAVTFTDSHAPSVPISSTNYLTTTPQTFTIADATPGWTDDLTVAQFDPTLGTLESVNITLTGNEDASIGAENLDATAALIGATETATLTLTLPDLMGVVSAVSSVTDSLSLGGFDGSQDFAGTSGRIDQGLTATANGWDELASTQVAPFVGTGTVTLPLEAVAASSLTGPGNLLTQLLDQAGANVSISYTYAAASTDTGSTDTGSTGTGSINTDSISCFGAGTSIATEHGDMAVEALRPGDRVRCVLGEAAEAIWIGHRRIDCTRHPNPAAVWPVRVRAGAFAVGVPRRDLLLSPDHAVFADHVLIPVKHLINGTTVAQEQCDSVTYYHIELPRHDVLLAEGLPAESYLDTGDRANFANGGKVVALYPELTALAWEAYGCAPLIVTGPILDAVRSRLAARVAKLAPRARRRRSRAA
jgi:collagen type I/II/III/V/XI/XXIV/XXVII alpha